MLSLRSSSFFLGDFWSELHTSAHDAPTFNWDRWDGRRRSLEIVPWICLPDVGSEWATQLGVHLTLELEVIVSGYSDA